MCDFNLFVEILRKKMCYSCKISTCKLICGTRGGLCFVHKENCTKRDEYTTQKKKRPVGYLQWQCVVLEEYVFLTQLYYHSLH